MDNLNEYDLDNMSELSNFWERVHGFYRDNKQYVADNKNAMSFLSHYNAFDDGEIDNEHEPEFMRIITECISEDEEND